MPHSIGIARQEDKPRLLLVCLNTFLLHIWQKDRPASILVDLLFLRMGEMISLICSDLSRNKMAPFIWKTIPCKSKIFSCSFSHNCGAMGCFYVMKLILFQKHIDSREWIPGVNWNKPSRIEMLIKCQCPLSPVISLNKSVSFNCGITSSRGI